MTDATQHTCMEYVPTRLERLWRFMGFRYHYGEEPEGVDILTGWMRTDIRLQFDWRDRLRLLSTGKLKISSIVHFDTPSPDVCKARVDWRISAPTEKDWK